VSLVPMQGSVIMKGMLARTPILPFFVRVRLGAGSHRRNGLANAPTVGRMISAKSL